MTTSPNSKQIEQDFLNALDKKLWNAADRLRHSLDAAVYKHAVLGLIFLKYVSDAFSQHQEKLAAQFRDPNHDYFLDPADYDDADDHAAAVNEELEERDYYVEKNVFWVPGLARWQTIANSATLAPGSSIIIDQAKNIRYEIKSLARLIDDALEDATLQEKGTKQALQRPGTSRCAP